MDKKAFLPSVVPPFTPSPHLTFNMCCNVSLSPLHPSLSHLLSSCPFSLNLSPPSSPPLSLPLYVVLTRPLRCAPEMGEWWELYLFMYGEDGVYSGEVGWYGGGRRGENWRDEDSLSTCINHEYRAAERLQPGESWREREKTLGLAAHTWTHTHILHICINTHILRKINMQASRHMLTLSALVTLTHMHTCSTWMQPQTQEFKLWNL